MITSSTRIFDSILASVKVSRTELDAAERAVRGDFLEVIRVFITAFISELIKNYEEKTKCRQVTGIPVEKLEEHLSVIKQVLQLDEDVLTELREMTYCQTQHQKLIQVHE